ncbi:hypothetical protein G7Z17_g2989 [Cylindrodendrum hubeiense]|uniref:Uncharacterized protein n=1 Tax=Cylindrodendrum hubeiense TaxID=595255 RepID=A0A9P5LDZ3_9HYPO|nr:hypothetical protein G7Z17_g2989 [Cylindrodendrum hubeiense]
MPRSKSAPQHPQAQPKDADNPETANVDGKLRKKLQNRLNQRKHRARLNNPSTATVKKRPQPFQTDRWRLDELGITPSATPLAGQLIVRVENSTKGNINNVNSSFTSLLPRPCQELRDGDLEKYGHQLHLMLSSFNTDPSSLLAPSPLADHVLHLVNFNAFRGFFTNKSILSQHATHIIPWPDRSEVVDIMDRPPSLTIVTFMQTDVDIPHCLVPTPSQTQRPHATWIDFIPFPRMRDNLIAQQYQFDHWDLMGDVIGDLLHKLMFSNQKTSVEPQGSSHLMLGDGLDNGMTANRNGFLLWGEPYKPENWEATPGFLRKWGWAVEGCDGLIESSNHWRALRGEELLQFSL